MRKLIFGINMTMDGCCDHTKGIANEEVHAYFTALLKEVDVLLYGRKTHQLLVPFWPDMAKNHFAATQSMGEFARAFDAVDKRDVVSRSMGTIEENEFVCIKHFPLPLCISQTPLRFSCRLPQASV